jgi:hypothetical protein
MSGGNRRFEVKRKAMILMVTAVLSLIILFSGCGAVITGSGNIVTKNFDNSGFTMVRLEDGFDVALIQSPSFGIEITADDNIFDYLEITQEGNTLKVRLKGGDNYINKSLKARISMPEILGINLSDGSDAIISGFNSSNTFSATLSDGSKLEGEIITGDIGFSLSDGSDVTLSGSGRDLMARSMDGSTLTLENFPVINADVNISSGGNATLNLSGTLNTNLTAGSKIIYSGDPKMGEISLSAGSVLKKK